MWLNRNGYLFLISSVGFSSALPPAQAQTLSDATLGPLRPVSAALAPERVVYEVFAAEVVASDQQSKDLRLSPEHREHAARRLQRVVGLRDAEYTALRAISHDLAAALDAVAREGDAVLKNRGLGHAERDAAIQSLSNRRNAALDDAIERWRKQVGARFRFIDDRIREHVAPGLRIAGGGRSPQ